MTEGGPGLMNISPQALAVYRRKFDALDLNKDGVISLREVASVAKVFGYQFTIPDLRDIFNKKDLDLSGDITFEEFVVAMMDRKEQNKALAPYRARFHDYDFAHRGYITADDAYPLLKKELGFDRNKTESLVDMYDKNRDYRLTITEFVPFIQRVDQLKAEIMAAFRNFDKDGDGAINYAEAHAVMAPQGFSDTDILNMISTYDEDGDGMLSYSEFARFWNVPIFAEGS